LHRAVESNDNDLVEFLCNQDKIDLNITDTHGNSALYYACANENSTIVKMLKFEEAKIVASDETLANILMKKANEDNLNSIKLFYKAGANFSVCNSDSENIAHYAADNQNADILNFLAKNCDHKIFEDVSKKDNKRAFERIKDPNLIGEIIQLMN
jgi:ankyrin repeat protein